MKSLSVLSLLALSTIAQAATIQLSVGEVQQIGGFTVSCGGGSVAPRTYWVCTLANPFFGVHATGRGETKAAAHADAINTCRAEHTGFGGAQTCSGASETCEQVSE